MIVHASYLIMSKIRLIKFFQAEDSSQNEPTNSFFGQTVLRSNCFVSFLEKLEDSKMSLHRHLGFHINAPDKFQN